MTLKESTRQLYNRVLNKLDIQSLDELNDSEDILHRIDSLSSNSYKIMALKAIYHIAESDKQYKPYYSTLLLLQKKEVVKKTKLPMTLPELLAIEVKEKNPLKQLVNAMVVWINTHYPLRLDYYNIKINPDEITDKTNYATFKNGILTLYLNDFKNVKSMGPQVIKYDSDVIRSYISTLSNYFSGMPIYLLYRWTRSGLKPFSSRIAYGSHLSDLLKKYTGHSMTINDIRKIHESALIQGSDYASMAPAEKNKQHRKLLHSTKTANEVYNILS